MSKSTPIKPKRDMYNPDLKKRFITETYKKDSIMALAKVVFKSVAKYENDWGSDFCTRNSDEIEPVLENILGMRVSSKWIIVNILKDYIEWCIKDKYNGAIDGMKDIDIDTSGYEKIKQQMVSNPIQLQKYFDEIFRPESDETIDIIYRCYLWMAYMGIPEEDALNVKSNDIDFNIMKIKYGDKDAPIYFESLPAFRGAVALSSFYYRHPNYESAKLNDRITGDMILRGVEGKNRIKEDIDKYNIRSVVSRKFSDKENIKKTGKKLSFYRIWISGLFYRMYEHERAGNEVDFTNTAKDDINKPRLDQDGNPVQYKFNHSMDNERQRISRKINDYTEDYNRWKYVFGI